MKITKFYCQNPRTDFDEKFRDIEFFKKLLRFVKMAVFENLKWPTLISRKIKVAIKNLEFPHCEFIHSSFEYYVVL